MQRRSSRSLRCRAMRGAAALLIALLMACAADALRAPVHAQVVDIITFPPRPANVVRKVPRTGPQDQMLIRAEIMNYDYTNERVSAVGNVQIYYNDSTLEADRVIYDQKTKRLHAEGNVRLTQPDGTVTYGEIMDLGDDFRDGFVDSLRLDGPDQTRFAATRADRTNGTYTVFQNGVYTACEPCADDPRKPPKWQVKAARIIHDQTEKMIYFEEARLEFFGIPLAYIPYFSAPDPTVKRKTGVLIPNIMTSKVYGVGVKVPYYFALAPDYDLTFTPTITSMQGPLVDIEWRQRLLNGSYSIRATGLFQLDKDVFLSGGLPTPGYRDWRGSLETSGQFPISDKWTWGWDGTLLSDQTYFQDYGLQKYLQSANLLRSTPDYALSQIYLVGRGDRSYFDLRTMYFYGFSTSDAQQQIPIVHPVMDHEYVYKSPVIGGELSFRSNLTSLSRTSADFDPITTAAVSNPALCATASADTSVKSNCLLRGVPGTYTRFSVEATWRRTIIDSYGQIFTPFVTLRGDVGEMKVDPQLGVSNYIQTGESQVVRAMPTVGLEYRYPLISVQSWGTATVEPIAQLIFRPNETKIGAVPNEDAQSLIFDDSNLFKVDKFSGWDRVEGGSRANVGVQFTAQFNRGGNINFLFGQSYQLFGQNSFAVGGLTNTGIQSGLDTTKSDYVARVTYQPNSLLLFTSRFRFNEADFTLQRTELEAGANFGRWSTSVMYGHYAAQPALGFLTDREGILASAKYKVTENWQVLGAVRYDLHANQVSQTQIGVGYVDDCLILALNYISDYAYAGSIGVNHSFMMQIGLRTLGGNTSGQSTSTLTGLAGGR
jgi:LPS-assembly protein